MKKFDNTGGISSVRVVPLMQDGGSVKRLAEGPPSEKPMNTFPIPVPDDKPISSEPDYDTGAKQFPGPGLEFQDFILNTPVIDPRDMYPTDPDPGIMSLPGITRPGLMGINPNLLQANMLKPAGILSINKVYDI